MEERTRVLEGLLPYAVREKYRYYVDYMHDRVYEIALEERVEYRSRDVRSTVELVLLMRFLYGYFVLGFENYERMLEYLEGKQVRGFQIGRMTFAKTSFFSEDWRQVSTELKRLTAQSELREYIQPSLSSDEAIRRLLQSSLGSPLEKSDYE